MEIQQRLKASDVMEKSRKNVHLPDASLQSKKKQITITTEVIIFGSRKVVPQMMQSRASLFVTIRQQNCSLSVLLILMMMSKKILSTSEGMYVKTIFLNTKCTRLKYFPGARAYLQISLVMKIIQKLAATLNDILPIILIVHKETYDLRR